VIKAVFSALLLQSSVSHDPSEITLIWFDAQETFSIIINVKKPLCYFIFFYFSGSFDKWKAQKNRIYLKLKSLVTLIVYTF